MNPIQGKARTIRELLSGAKYAIDYYQREYKWETKQVTELVDDLTSKFLERYDSGDPREAVANYSHYFLGSIIISDKNGTKYVVDGQQRLTTLTLLLMYLNQLQAGLQSDSKVIIDDLIFSAKYGKKSFNINVEERVECMDALFEGRDFDTKGRPEAITNIAGRYADINEALPDELKEDALPFFIDWLIENVHLVEITAFSDDDAYTIFETMNDRGLSLSPIDMLKSFLLANIADSAKRDACNQHWKDRVQKLAKLGKDFDTDCFKSWLRSRYAKTIRERKKDAEPGDFDRIGSEFHRWVREVKEELELDGTESYVNFIQKEFDFYAGKYLELASASRTLQPELEHAFYNAQAGFTLQPVLLLATIQPKDDDASVLKKWRLASMYLDILLTRRIWNYRSIAQSTMKYPIFKIMQAIRSLKPDKLAKVLHDDLSAQPEAFANNEQFALHGMNRKQIIRILARMTEYVEVQSGMPSQYLVYTASTGKKRYEVEHIWPNKYERFKGDFQHPSDFDAYRNRIGGLLLLPKSFNASYGDKTYTVKRQHYFGQQSLLAKSLHSDCYKHNPGFKKFLKQSGLQFNPYDDFGKAELDERQALYRALAEHVWDPGRLLLEAKK